MGNLLPPNLPLYLYRYRAIAGSDDYGKAIIEREIAAIREPYVFCAAFRKLNDPMEGFFRPSLVLKNRSEFTQIAQQVYDNKANVGIASFSDTNENELMWTHYAGHYAGICIEYYSGNCNLYSADFG